MKDADESGKISYGLIYGSLIKRHPMIYSAVLAISIIALTAMAVFLVSDILSSNSGNAPAGLSGAFPFLSPVKSEQIESPDTATANNTSLNDGGNQQPSLNKSELNKSKINESGTEKRISPLNSTSPGVTSISDRQTYAIKKANGKQLSDDSSKSPKKKKHRSSKSSSQAKAGTSSIAAVKGSPYADPSQGNMSTNVSQDYGASINLSNSSETLALTPGLSTYEASANAVPAEKQLEDANTGQSNPADINISDRQDLEIGSPANRGDGPVVIPMLPVSPVPPVSAPPDSAPSVSNPDVDSLSNSGSPAEEIAAPAEAPAETSPEPRYPQNDISSTADNSATADGSSGQTEDASAIQESSAVQEDGQSQDSSQITSSDNLSPRSRNAQDDQINKKSRAAKNPKKTMQPVKPVKTRAKPARPSRDRSAD